MSAPRQRDRIVFAKLYSPPRQSYFFGNFLVTVDHPTSDFAPVIHHAAMAWAEANSGSSSMAL